MGRIFGTDGVRGRANVDVTAELALDLSVAAAHVLVEGRPDTGERPRALVARDPRASGEFLCAAVSAGLASAGMDVLDAGVLPTPGLAHLVATRDDVDLGVMISASHNPMPDNGIKFFDRFGHKLADDVEDAITDLAGQPWQRPTGAAVGRVRTDHGASQVYAAHCVNTLDDAAPLTGLRVVVDCAHGAASVVAPMALRSAGAQVTVIGAEPDGLNINDGYGSTHLERLQAAVVEQGADAGVAFDGDADRCLAVDAAGRVVDGDQVLAVLALGLKEQGRLVGDTVVATVMSNLGLRLALQEHGLHLVTTAVGDRYVLEEMRAKGYVLGGEQSGHVVLAEHNTTGDGLLTALHLLQRMTATGRPLADLAAVVTRLPQVLLNVPGVDKTRVSADDVVVACVRDVEAELGERGRVLLRASGTEPLVRVMVEAPDEETAQKHADRIADVVLDRLSLSSVG
ncbi:phosphoglucosamine mutase [Aquipuribacter nitratireducens]|uniref:Phosphoglucosamine mutase n=1 Tax=Aquipuribacter nitratireducens TaxID=650104 RepID=A0ABW0GJS1_9MICO